jgi:SAM-dependent methyltransferase
MGVQERLSLEAVSAHTLIACEHVHRYRFAARLCAGLRVLDVACGTGYGTAILGERASTALGVDNDAATIDTARVAVGAADHVRFEVADAEEFLRREAVSGYEAIVCFEGLEHFPDPQAVLASLRRHAARGSKLIISVPNSRAFDERNEFHVTDFGYEKALEAFGAFEEVTVLYQYLAEGSLIRGERPAQIAGEFVLAEHGEPEFANHFIACVNFARELADLGDSTRMQLAVAPNYNRHMINIERANAELWRENARIGRHRIGVGESAAAALLARLDDMRQRAELAEARGRQLEEQIGHLEGRLSLLDTPRHRAVEQLREKLMRTPPLYALVRLLWRLVRP